VGIAKLFGKQHLSLGWRAKRGAHLQSLLYRVNNNRIAMAGYHRTPRANQIKISLSVDIYHPTSISLGYERRMPTDSIKGANRGIYTTWNNIFGAFK
jgi:hypothetical protein